VLQREEEVTKGWLVDKERVVRSSRVLVKVRHQSSQVRGQLGCG
jgi:hypothetical protein